MKQKCRKVLRKKEKPTVVGQKADQKRGIMKVAKQMNKMDQDIYCKNCIRNGNGVLVVNDKYKRQLEKEVLRTFSAQKLHEVTIVC